MRQSILYRLKKGKVLLFIIALGLSLSGSYQVYHDQYDTLLKEIMVILYSTFKLFTFSPTSAITNESHLAYELAIWVAPAFTMVGFFTIFERAYKVLAFKVFHWGKDPLVLMGDHEETLVFIKNMQDADPSLSMMLLVDLADPVDLERYRDLKVEVVKIDFSNPSNEINRLTLRDKRVFHEGRMISFDVEPLNYARVEALYQMTEIKKQVSIYLRTDSYRLKELIEKKMDELYYFDIHYFNIQDLLIKHLLERSTFTVNDPPELAHFGKSHQSLEDISADIGHYRLLMVGVSDISESLILQASNLLTISASKRLRLTVITENKAPVERFISRRREFERVIELDLLELPSSSRLLEEEVQKRHAEDPYSAVFFTSSDTRRNLFNVDELADALEGVPFAVFTGADGSMEAVIDSLRLRHPSITSFGDGMDVLTGEMILEEELFKQAKAFNAGYNRVMNHQLNYDEDRSSTEEQWLSLSNVKKESSAYQSAHAPTKLKLLKVMADSLDTTVASLLAAWNEDLEDLSYDDKVSYVEKNPYLNYLSALEHRRWNNFYYLRDFVYDKEKNELKKTHNCLVDEWELFYTEALRDKLFYDTLSTLMLGLGEHDE